MALHDCDGSNDGVCATGLMRELAELSVEDRKDRLKEISREDKLALRKAHLECGKCVGEG